MGFIEHIKHKPYEYRVRVTWIVLIICAVLLLVLWVVTSMIKKDVGGEESGILNQIDTNLQESREYWESVMPKKPENLTK
jgi:hypothetical protein